jgi:outer membrane lipopolysaccharide assembly protein LptE/RlpB
MFKDSPRNQKEGRSEMMGVRAFAIAALVLSAAVCCLGGCGYTYKSLLPEDLKTICVDNFVNKIPVTTETTDERMYRGYKPGMEYDVTKAVVNRFIFDGNLKVTEKKNADLILTGELIDYKKESLRYDTNDNVEEYRIRLVTNLELWDVKNKAVLWRENNFAGESTYRTGGSLAQSETNAIRDAESDLARRIVERTVEAW